MCAQISRHAQRHPDRYEGRKGIINLGPLFLATTIGKQLNATVPEQFWTKVPDDVSPKEQVKHLLNNHSMERIDPPSGYTSTVPADIPRQL